MYVFCSPSSSYPFRPDLYCLPKGSFILAGTDQQPRRLNQSGEFLTPCCIRVPVCFLATRVSKLILAAMSATLATLFTSPADCVKTRMQVNPDLHPTLRKAIQRIYLVCQSPRLPLLDRVSWCTARNQTESRLYQDRGIAGFFSGSTLRISRKAMSGAIGWSVYEGLLIFFRDRQ